MTEPTLQGIDFHASNAEDTQVLTRDGMPQVRQRPIPEWEVEARNRLAAAVERFSQPLADLVERDANEGDTRMLVADFLSDGLNYGKYDSLTTSYRTRGESVDYGILLDGELFAFLEVKACGQSLDARNLRQVKTHAAAEGLSWVVLTNGRHWQVHHVVDADSGTTALVVDVDLFSEGSEEANVDALFHLCREAVQDGRLDNLRAWREALAAEPLARLLRSRAVVDTICAEIRRDTGHTGHVGDTEDVLHALRKSVLARGLGG
ncbi:hypothetical protein FHX37_2550 [Haloactinospora alba]|uniref:Type I restriction and modification enzyme subunit R-like protein n=1 Tax=Haloactinospora alba TaxID=405555 RepID=A0A543NL39_9ACTN|nr:hypothetical protein [Haloactinospora alba]TQN32575.1 hypothetical protein FHX37_2550 [Haloactinospora alba]